MKHLRIYFLFLTLISGNLIFAHKDRIEKATSYLFYFGKERIEIKSSEIEKLNHYTNLIISRKKQITSVECFFKTKEVVAFTFKNFQCSQIEILVKNKRSLFVPEKTVKKISSINLKTVCLLWSDADKPAFESGYFFISFSLKKEELPLLQLFFKNYKFSEAIIWNKSGENSRQWKKF